MTGDTRWLKLLLTTTLCGITACGGVESNVDEPCDWVVTAARSPQPGEGPFEDRAPLLRDPENPNSVQGPGMLRAIVKSDSLHHPHIYIEDTATGSRRLLRRGSAPRWSPNGKQIACTVWESIERPWLLCIVDVGTGHSFVPELNCLTMDYQWSPDGKSIAVGGVLIGQATNVLCLLSVPARTSRMVDTLSVFSDYQFGWSPDSRYLAVQRPTRVIDEEDPSAADLWIIDVRGPKCQLTNTPDDIESEPKWIDASRLLCLREQVHGNQRGQETPTVLELGRRGSPTVKAIRSSP